MAYILATTEEKVRWYKYKYDQNLKEGEFELIEILDLKLVPLLGDKAAAKDAAKALGLKTWRYVKI
ncbi:hypothetical protein VXQ92_04155 [Acinetobacter sp. 228]|uniref:hypothetical protein n=1 Tax=Acinetobacter sp. 228 TaxID=3114700 RepID=UPI003A899B80